MTVIETERLYIDEVTEEEIQEIIEIESHKENRDYLWLDVYPDNEIGIKLYESLGMHCDGVLRQNYLAERGYLDQIIYSLLRCEYETFRHM